MAKQINTIDKGVKGDIVEITSSIGFEPMIALIKEADIENYFINDCEYSQDDIPLEEILALESDKHLVFQPPHPLSINIHIIKL